MEGVGSEVAVAAVLLATTAAMVLARPLLAILGGGTGSRGGGMPHSARDDALRAARDLDARAASARDTEDTGAERDSLAADATSTINSAAGGSAGTQSHPAGGPGDGTVDVSVRLVTALPTDEFTGSTSPRTAQLPSTARVADVVERLFHDELASGRAVGLMHAVRRARPITP